MVKKNIPIFILILISLIPLFDLIHPGIPLTHDGQDHLARIASFYTNLLQGNFVPRWAGNLNWGYGHPILMFLYPLPSYIASFFLMLGLSLSDSLKLVFALTYVGSGIGMFLWVRNFTNDYSGLLAGALYMIAPYRFVDLYVRGAIGEHVAFLFVPLVFYFLLKLFNSYSYLCFAGGSLSLAFLILSHNAITIMFLPLIFIYSLYLIYNDKKQAKRIGLIFILMTFFGFGLSAFFLVPAYFEGKYTLRDIVTAGEYSSRFVTLDKFLYSPWSYGGTGQLSVMFGSVQIVGLFSSSCFLISRLLVHKIEKNIILMSIFLIYSIFSILLMTSNSKIFYESFSILQKFQFPWRFMSVVVFSTSVITALFIYYQRGNNFIKNLSILLIIGFTLLFSKDYWHANGYLERSDDFFYSIYNGTTDTGESSPIWSVRFMESRPLTRIQVIEGSAEVSEVSRSYIEHDFIIKSWGKSRIVDNTLYFPDWSVYVNGRKISPEFQDPSHRGLITFFIEKGVSNVRVLFQETKLRIASNIFTIISLILLICFSKLNMIKILNPK